METKDLISVVLLGKGKLSSSMVVVTVSNGYNRFGWANASFELGLTFLGSHAKRALGACIPPDKFLDATKDELEPLLDTFGASPASTPDSELESDPFGGLPPPTPAAAVVQDPFEKAGTLQFRTPVATPAAKESADPFERLVGKPRR